MLTVSIVAAAALWIAAGTFQSVAVAAIAAFASVFNTWLIIRAKGQAEATANTLHEVRTIAERRRLVVIRNERDTGYFIADEELESLRDGE